MDDVLQTPTTPMREGWRVHSAHRFAEIAPAWQQLNESIGSSPLLHPAFVLPLIEHFGNGRVRLAILGDLDHPLAMALVEQVGVGSWRTFQPSQAPVGLWLQRSGTVTEKLCQQLLGSLPGAAISLSLTCQDPSVCPRPADTPYLSTLDYIETGHIQLGDSFPAYLSTRPKNVVRQVTRRLRRLDEIGLVPRLETISQPEQMAEAVNQFAAIESAGWKQSAGTAVRSGGVQASFYVDLLERFARLQKARVFRFWLGDKIAAMNLCIVGDATLCFLKTAHAEEFRKYSPGILMKHAIFEHCSHDPGVQRLEFTGRVYEWQREWIHGARLMYHVTYYRWPWLFRLKALTSALRETISGRSSTADAAAETSSLVTRTYPSFESLPDSYPRLFQHARGQSVFHSLPWFRAISEHLANLGEHVRVYGLERQVGAGSPLGALVLSHGSLNQPRFARRLNAASTFYTPAYAPHVDADHVTPQDCIRQLAHAAGQDPVRWSVIDLSPLDPSDATFGTLMTGLKECRFITDSYFHSANWYLDVAGRTYPQYLLSLPSALQNTLRRKRRHIEGTLVGRIEIVTDGKDIDRVITDYEQVYAASWKPPEPYPEFIRKLVRMCAEHGWLRLGTIFIDDKPIAAQIWIVFNGVASIYKLAYDKRHAQLSAGSVLTAALMEHVIDKDRVSIVDYLSGDDAYKKDWMSHRVERWGLIAFNPRTPHGLLAAVRHFGGRALRRSLRALPGKTNQTELSTNVT